MVIAFLAAPQPWEHICRNPVNANHNPRMLYGIVWIVKPRPHNPHFFPLAIAKHLFHPILGNNFNIVVQKDKVIAAGIGSPKVIDG